MARPTCDRGVKGRIARKGIEPRHFCAFLDTL
jgi:hypothetical protein